MQANPLRFRRLLRIWSFFGIAALAGTVAAAASPLRPFMPRVEDFVLFWWADGPPRFHSMTAPPASETLCFRSGTLGVALDTKRVRLLHAGRFAEAGGVEEALRPGDAGIFSLPPVALDLVVRASGREFRCVGRGEPSDDPFFFPVRFVEYGRFFQRVAIEDIEFADASGAKLSAKGWFEIAFWPDRAILSFDLALPADAPGAPPDPASSPASASEAPELEIVAGERRALRPAAASGPVSLLLIGPETASTAEPAPGVAVEPDSAGADGGLKLAGDATSGAVVLEIPRRDWRNAKGTYYPEEELDRLDAWRFVVRNDGEADAVVPLTFADARPPAITGFVPMLCDADGAPTGIPVQISKNWHRRPEKGALRHEGPWFRGSTFLRVPAGERREFVFRIAYARYGGVPAASHSQLSLIGWGTNQFWEQCAVGSFGETVCYEPGRAQRRCAIDDFRPLMTLTAPDAKPYGWAGNGGGGDFLMWIDETGKYRGFRGTRVHHRAYGPRLTDVVFAEETDGGEIACRVEVSVAAGDDFARAFHRIRYDVRRPAKWSRLAFLQLGADFYNETPSRLVARGDASGLAEEWEPIVGGEARDRSFAATGESPWVSIHGVERSSVGEGGAFASRGMIVRSWDAVLGGVRRPEPSVAVGSREYGRGALRTTIDLCPPEDAETLLPGDYVEAEVEIVMFPCDPAAYYGPNEDFRRALAAGANTWRLVLREAAGNALRLEPIVGRVVRSYPVEIVAGPAGEAECRISGGLGFVPATFRGLDDPGGHALFADGRPAEGAEFRQTDYDPASGTWSATFSLARDGAGPTRLELRRADP